MNQIKFRAWDPVDKKMYFTGQEGETDEKGDSVFQTYFDEDGFLCAVLITEMDVGCDQPMVTDRELKVMQYTGLKDENDVEIYEGDVFDYRCGGTKQASPYLVEDAFKLWEDIGEGLGDSYYRMDSFEIIRNIYENSNLLGETE